ncbi:pseudouridine synthase [Reichenbachiella ulvae]|uniref:pseudouridine synthase n=1 Tax=Reichenbachiella ulvae TaxID=2980104 RepID=UPI00298F9B98|nr:pseudouridine synthase [Reichenbachiella ulvae]
MLENNELLEIVYQDEDFVAINKPHGLLVHRSKMAANTDRFALQELRNQLDRHVYPPHRLDRKTGGVLLFALNEEALHHIRVQFEAQEISKEYLTLVRGYTDDQGCIDYALTNDKGKTQDAITHYETLARTGDRGSFWQACYLAIFAGQSHTRNGSNAPTQKTFCSHISSYHR